MSILDVAVTNSTKITKWPSLPDSARVYALNDGARIFHINRLAVGQNRAAPTGHLLWPPMRSSIERTTL